MTSLTIVGGLPTVVTLIVLRGEGALIGLPLISWPCLGVATALGGWMIARRGEPKPLRSALLGVLIAAGVWMVAFALVVIVGVLISGKWEALAMILFAPLVVALPGLPPAVVGATLGVTLAERRLRQAG